MTVNVFWQSNVLFADGSSLEMAGKDGEVAGASTTGPTLVETHERRMEAAPHAPMDDGFGGTIGDDFGRKILILFKKINQWPTMANSLVR